MTLVPLDIPSGFYRIGTDYEQSGRWREGSLVRWLDGSLRPIGGWQNRKEDFALQPIRGMHAWEALNTSTWLAGGSHNALVAMTGGGLCYDITPQNLATGRKDAAVSAGYGKGAYGIGFWGTPRQQLSNAIPEPATFWNLDNFGELMVGCHYDDGRLLEWGLGVSSGAEKITNNSFTAGTDWTLGTGWAISGGDAKWTGTTAANLDSFPGANYSSDEPIETTNITKYLKLESQSFGNNVRNDLYIDVSNIPNKESYMLSHNLYSDLSNGAITDISFSLFIDYSNNLDVSMLSNEIISGGPTLNNLSYSDTNTNVTQGITWFRSEVDISSNNIGSDISWVHIATFDISNVQMDLSMRYLYGAPSLLYGDSEADISAQSFIQYFDCSNGVLKFKN